LLAVNMWLGVRVGMHVFACQYNVDNLGV